MEKLSQLQSDLITRQSKSLFACSEHVEVMMDIVVDELETFPELRKDSGHKCDLCNQDAIYEVSINEN
jgi:CxxH/CxxC protein (TIGR04129 family)